MQCNTIQCNAIQCNIMQYNTMQYNTIQYNTIQYNIIQYNTIQYNTIQYNTIQGNRTKISIRRWSIWCCRSAWKFCCNETAALRLSTTSNRHTLDVLSIKCTTNNVSKNEKIRHQLCYLFNVRKWKPLLQISPVFPLEIKQTLTFACRGSDPGGGAHIFPLHNPNLQ